MSNVERVTIRCRNAYGEFVVRAYAYDGKRLPEADYYAHLMTQAAQLAKLAAGSN